MSTKVIYTCDRCRTETTDGSQQWLVGIVAKPLNSAISNMEITTAKLRMHVCRECCENMGLVPQPAIRKPETITPPSLEDLIREIVQTTIQESQ